MDVPGEIGSRLPEDLAGLAGPIAAGLRGPAVEAVDRLVATPAAQEVWSRANRRAHETFLAIVKDETRPGISTADGSVTVDVRELVIRLADTIGLPGAVVERIPEDVGMFTVFESESLADAQDAVRVVEWAGILLLFVILGLFASAIFLAEGWRRVAVRNVGFVVLVDGLLLLAAQRISRTYVLDNYMNLASNRGVVGAVWWISTELLRNLAWSGVVLDTVSEPSSSDGSLVFRHAHCSGRRWT